MNPTPAEVVSILVAALGGGGLVGTVTVAWINRKPRHTAEAETQVAHASAAVSVSEAFEKLVSGLQDELDRKETELAAMRADIHKLRNRLMGLDCFVRALLRLADESDALIITLGGTPLARPQLPDQA